MPMDVEFSEVTRIKGAKTVSLVLTHQWREAKGWALLCGEDKRRLFVKNS